MSYFCVRWPSRFAAVRRNAEHHLSRLSNPGPILSSHHLDAPTDRGVGRSIRNAGIVHWSYWESLSFEFSQAIWPFCPQLSDRIHKNFPRFLLHWVYILTSFCISCFSAVFFLGGKCYSPWHKTLANACFVFSIMFINRWGTSSVENRKFHLLRAQWSLHVPPSLTCTNSTFCPHSVFTCFVWIWEQTTILSLYTINWLVCIIEAECVYCAVRAASLNKLRVTYCTWRLSS